MRTSLILATCVFGLSTVVIAPSAMGQGRAERRPRTTQKNSTDEIKQFWDPAKIMEIAVNNLAKRYSLNDEQKAYTNEMMTTRVTQFLEKHQDEIWPLLRELVYHQRTGEPPSSDIAKDLGPRVLKIIEEAKKEIYESNREWRKSLTDEQKKVHDFDMNQMDKTFAAMRQNFTQWSDGTPKSTNIFPPPPTGVRQPGAPPKPDAGIPTKAPQDQPVRLVSHFAQYVKQFIEDYELTADQIETANSILREIEGRAKNHEQAKAKEIAAVKEGLAKEKDLKKLRSLKQQQRELTQPLDDLFAELKKRLDSIPEKAQLERFRAKSEPKPDGRNASGGRQVKPAAAGDSQSGGY